MEESASYISAQTPSRPTVAIITGSGLGAVADDVEAPESMPYGVIPHFPSTSVQGHVGELVIGRLAGKEVAFMRGRVHFYEGYSLQRITFPIRVMHRLGIDTVIVTNAAGGLREDQKAGDLMLITDHINLVGMAGFNPLRGPNDPRLGPRFVEMSVAYDVGLRDLALSVAEELGVELRQGTYAMSAGPTFETPADVRFLRLIGADAVGMSTVPEVIVVRHEGMRALGLSHISNVIPVGGVPSKDQPMSQESLHQEVLDAGREVVPKLSLLIKGILSRMQEV
ncbi:MAG: purine-nucleoside phosphorylase [Chloroflexi bacterium B3_Chlor]|nr:MAG: purine-nucleoside phosphorylase [Chloroflexi bacterium B3_Chlor]